VLGRPETLAAAFRRSVPLIVIVVLLHIAGVNAYVQLQGSRYEAEASVLLTPEDIGNIITNTQSVSVDPERLEELGVALAQSPELYVRTARRTGGVLGTGDDLEDITKVGAANDILKFKVTTDDREESARIANAVSSEYRRWRRDLQGERIDRALTELRRQLRQEPSDSARRPELRQRINDLRLLSSLNTGNTIPVETATTARKVSPAPVRDSLIGAGIGLLVALLLVVAREAIDTKVRSEEDVEDLLETPVLATVQRLPRRSRLVMFGRREHEFGDVYALLAANIVQAKTPGVPLSVVITSSVAQEGKTATAANLAVALARRGSRVVVADFDTRKPSLGELFRVPREAPGVTQVLRGGATLAETKWSVSLNGMGPMPQRVVAAAVAGNGGAAPGSLEIVPAGGVLRASSAAHVEGIKDILRELKVGADIVLCDTSPALLTVETTELTQLVDRVVLVVRHGHVTRRSLRALGRHVQGWHAELLGAVVTDAPLEDQRSYYYGAR
jgi:Mrp family chromosome partitioning ATPase